MNFLRSIILAVILLFPISNSFGAIVTFVDTQEFEDGGSTVVNGVEFNPTGTKMFVTGVGNSNVHQYALSTGFDVSTASFRACC